MPPGVVIAGALAQKPHQAGHTWQFLQYLLGFRRLGWEVLFLDRLTPEMCGNGSAVGGTAQPVAVPDSRHTRYFAEVMRRFGLEQSCCLMDETGQAVFGVSRRQVLERARRSAFLVNVMGYLDDPDVLAAV